MKSLIRLMASASILFAGPAIAQVVTLPIINTPSGKTLAGGSVIIDSAGVEKGTISNPFLTSASTSHTTYTLLNAATSTGAQTVAPDTYTLTFPTAFNGATISVAVTDPSGNVVTTAYTSAPTTPVAGYYGATSVTATASGGTPTGSLKLNGGPPASANITSPLDVNTVIRATPTDRGLVVTTAGTAQQMMPANTSRRGYVIQNQSSGACYISTIATATQDFHSLLIAAGVYYETPPTHVAMGAVWIICAVSSASVYAREF